MANQNLSQFTEKLFVADADHTFIWDTANAISKRVSRNSWLNSGTLTSDAPVTISQTWNGTGSTVFKALVVNATTPGTTSSSSSLLLDLQVGGVTQISVSKVGMLDLATSQGSGGLNFAGGFYGVMTAFNWQLRNQNGYIGIGASGSAADTLLYRDAANTLALRNGAAAQTFNVYGTYTSGTSYERLTLSAPSAANAIIGTNKGSGGGTARGLEFQTDGVTRMTLASNGLTIGSLNINPANSAIYNAAIIGFGANSVFVGAPSDGVLRITNSALTSFNRLQFGGETLGYPALKRVGTELQVVIASTAAAINVAASDADLTFIEDRYRRKGAGSPEGVVTAPIGAVYHCTDGGAGTSFYVKESGTGNTGWVGK